MTGYDPERHHRRSLRLPGYDYTRCGAYFVTLVTQNRECLFGEVRAGRLERNEFGQIVAEAWAWLGDRYPGVEQDEWVVMPNHLHAILALTEEDRRDGALRRKPLGGLIAAFKTVSTKGVNQRRGTPGATLWQRDFYDHIIRDQTDLDRIRQYIHENPLRWPEDPENPTTQPLP